MRKKLTIIILNCTLIFLAGTFYAFGQDKEVALKDKRVTIKMNKVPLGKIFRELMMGYEVPIGFEESIFDREHNDYEFETNLPTKVEQKDAEPSEGIRVSIEVERLFDVKEHWISINAENSRLEDVLNIIVKQMENYKWEINDGVINIFPVRSRDKRYEELLKLNIKNFRVAKSAPIGRIRTKIFDLPEVKKFLDENNIKSSSFRADPEYTDIPLSTDLDYSNLTFRELLNKITRIKRGGWILKQNKIIRKDLGEHIEISI